MASRKNIPNHVGLIIDGNRRWAKAKGLPKLEGHRQGVDNLEEIALHAFDQGVSYVSAFVFSTENWSRSKEEVSYLMKLVKKTIERYSKKFEEAGVKVIVVGSRERLEQGLVEAIERVEDSTYDGLRGVLALCFNYGGQQEIVDMTKNLIRQGIKSEDITAESISKALYHPELPPLDLLIRTSGEQRTSGFMLWRAAYAEMYFSDKFWPQFSDQDLDAALDEFESRQRRFGK